MDKEISYRTGTIHRDMVDKESRTIELSFSSDAAAFLIGLASITQLPTSSRLQKTCPRVVH
ncbi:MAG: hypothetical protein QF600_00820 [Verrucomicrobiota bacterium]|nr:hypothetical protein [Verrucomicrobiota bacterium]